MSLRLDWCSIQAAKYAVQHWHYSRSYTIFPCVCVGAWEDDKFIGAVIFARGANKHIGSPYGLTDTQCSELVRVALSDKHIAPTSQIVSGAIKMVDAKEKELRLLVSYADKNQAHLGTIYQAMNWVYVGETPSSYLYKWTDGRLYHQREVSSTGVKPYFGKPRRVPKIDECERVSQVGKHKYLYPLDRAMRKQIAPLAKPYPKRTCGQSVEGDTIGDQSIEVGSIPTGRSE
jgi:hypothetical protein